MFNIFPQFPVGFVCQYNPRTKTIVSRFLYNIQKWKLKCIIWAWLQVGLCLIRGSWLTDACCWHVRGQNKTCYIPHQYFLPVYQKLWCIVLPSQKQCTRLFSFLPFPQNLWKNFFDIPGYLQTPVRSRRWNWPWPPKPRSNSLGEDTPHKNPNRTRLLERIERVYSIFAPVES